MVDVYGNSNVIQLVDPRTTLNNIRKDVQEAKVVENKLSELISCEQFSKISENQQIYAVKKVPSTSSTTNTSRISSSAKSSSLTELQPSLIHTECVICCDKDVDSVLYSCGHMCMCFQCAVQQWAAAGECPLCRATIRDVIRTYRA